MSMYSLIPNSTVNEIDTAIDANVFFDSSSIVKEIIEFEEVPQLHPIPCNWYQSMNCILFHVIDTIVSFILNWIKEIMLSRISCSSNWGTTWIASYSMWLIPLVPFIPNWIVSDNVIPAQLLLQLRNSMNCILFLVIDTIVSFDSQLNWKW